MLKYGARIQEENGETTKTELIIDSCVAAGYTGRDQASVQAHIDELKKLGVATPYSVPAMYWISSARISNAEEIFVIGKETSPEVEFFIGCDEQGTAYVTVASDHTDRALETVSVSKSKQVCDKVLGDLFWRIGDIEDQWGDIKICSEVKKDGEWIEYQAGYLCDIMHYSVLRDRVREEKPAGKSPGIFSGTLPIIGGEPVYTSACRIIMRDPQLEREIVKEYQITTLPDRS